jgi:hypothetical protein
MRRLIPAGVLALTALALLWALPAAAADGSATEPEQSAAQASDEDEQQQPSFRPGAEVTLAITLRAPKYWQLNYLTPLRLQFDEKYLKDAPLAVKQPVWDFELDSYLQQYTAEIPIRLGRSVPDGTLEIPLEILASICESSGESCTFCNEHMVVDVAVLRDAPPDAENQALSEGAAESTYRLSVP